MRKLNSHHGRDHSRQHQNHPAPSVRIEVAPPMWDSNWNQEKANRRELYVIPLSARGPTEEEGISEAALYNWRKAARAEGRLLPDGDQTPAGWTAADKLAAMDEIAALNEAELPAWCRRPG